MDLEILLFLQKIARYKQAQREERFVIWPACKNRKQAAVREACMQIADEIIARSEVDWRTKAFGCGTLPPKED